MSVNGSLDYYICSDEEPSVQLVIVSSLGKKHMMNVGQREAGSSESVELS